MCGIAGIFHYRDHSRVVNERTLAAMTRCIAHRGPDDEGFFVEGPLGLGHRRLAIVDLNSTGHQPMAGADGEGAITYNGEFYNQSEFRTVLQSKGCRFRGASDTETLLNLLSTWGPDALTWNAGDQLKGSRYAAFPPVTKVNHRRLNPTGHHVIRLARC
jgi:asparagine synthase (glutamine-hydrolysing)